MVEEVKLVPCPWGVDHPLLLTTNKEAVYCRQDECPIHGHAIWLDKWNTRTDPTPSVVKDGATGEEIEKWKSIADGGIIVSTRLTEQLAAANAEIVTWQQQCDSVQQTNDAMVKRLLKQEAEIERLTVYANPLTERLAIAHNEIERLKQEIADDPWVRKSAYERISGIETARLNAEWEHELQARDAFLAQCEGALKEQHNWHLNAGEINLETEEGKPPILIDNGAEYADSAMYERTSEALAAIAGLKEKE